MNQTIGTRIQMLRKQNGMSQQNLADKLSISRQTISKWESDQSLPDLDTLLKMSELFNVSIAYIVGVEEDNKSISQMYELMQTLLNNQQKANKTRNIIQLMTILLCILSLFLNISLRREISSSNDVMIIEDSNERFDLAYGWTKNENCFIDDNPYLVTGSRVRVNYYDLEKMITSLTGDLYLAEYSENTKVVLNYYSSFNEDKSVSIELKHKEGNLYTFNQEIPLDSYNRVTLQIEDGSGIIKMADLTDTVPTEFFDYVLINHINLFVPLNSDGELQLNKLEFDPTYYNTSNDNRYHGYFDGYFRIKIYTDMNKKPIDEFEEDWDKKVVLELSQNLPLNAPIYFEYEYFVDTGKDIFEQVPYKGRIGCIADGDKSTSIIITNKNERVRIFQNPAYYEDGTYYFKD